jgi:transposase
VKVEFRRAGARVYLDQIDGLSEKVAEIEKAIACEARRGATTRRLQTMPGVGPITAMAIETFAPPRRYSAHRN